MSAAEAIIGRLTRVKAVGPDKWAAACPLCESRNGRPISIRAMPDGRALLHPFCCCDTGDVLSAIGLRMSDLFPKGMGEFKPERKPFDAAQALQAVAHEIMVAYLIAHDMGRSGRGDKAQEERLHLAEVRLSNALMMIGELPVPDEIKRIRRSA
jgi:hypothetical protein